MLKKIVGIFVISTLVMISSLCSVVLAKEVDSTKVSSEKYFEFYNGNEFEWFETGGPITSLFDIYKIDFLDGDPIKIQEIKQILNITYTPGIIEFITVQCSNFSFTIEYKKNVPYLIPIISEFSYFTLLFDADRPIYSYLFNGIRGRSHIVTVKGFNGEFQASRILGRFFPDKFIFRGEFEEVIIVK